MKVTIFQFAFVVIALFCCIACDPKKSTEPEEPEKPVTPEQRNTAIDSIYRYSLSNGTEKLQQVIFYTYDKAGNITCQLDSMTLVKYLHKTEMKYDSHNNLTDKIDYMYVDEDNWDKEAWIEYTYSGNDKLASNVFYIYLGDIKVLVQKGTYTWQDDTHAQCVAYTYDLKNLLGETTLSSIQSIEYTYNTRGDVVKSVAYDFANEVLGECLSTDDYVYDEYGNVTSHIYKEKDIVKWQETNKYEYDSAGNILVRWYSSSSSETPPASPTTKYVYFY